MSPEQVHERLGHRLGALPALGHVPPEPLPRPRLARCAPGSSPSRGSTCTRADDQVAFNKWLFSKSCQPGVQGNVGTLASPSDPLFNLMHPLFDKLAHVMRLAPQYTNARRRDVHRPVVAVVRQHVALNDNRWRATSYGSAFDDKMPFENLPFINVPGSLAHGEMYTNEQLWGLLDPSNRHLPYIYDQFTEWGTCAAGPVRQLDARGRDGRRRRRRRRGGSGYTPPPPVWNASTQPGGPAKTSRARCSRPTTAAAGARPPTTRRSRAPTSARARARPTPRARGRPRRRVRLRQRDGGRDALRRRRRPGRRPHLAPLTADDARRERMLGTARQGRAARRRRRASGPRRPRRAPSPTRARARPARRARGLVARVRGARGRGAARSRRRARGRKPTPAPRRRSRGRGRRRDDDDAAKRGGAGDDATGRDADDDAAKDAGLAADDASASALSDDDASGSTDTCSSLAKGECQVSSSCEWKATTSKCFATSASASADDDGAGAGAAATLDDAAARVARADDEPRAKRPTPAPTTFRGGRGRPRAEDGAERGADGEATAAANATDDASGSTEACSSLAKGECQVSSSCEWKAATSKCF